MSGKNGNGKPDPISMRLGGLAKCLDYLAVESGRDRTFVAKTLLKAQLGLGLRQYERDILRGLPKAKELYEGDEDEIHR